ncbi:MAG: FAD-dependent oxidoreductase [Pseudomonadota bacterium]
MSAAIQYSSPKTHDSYATVVIGAGPVGIALATAIAKRNPQRSTIIFGAEQSKPYDRVRLSSLLAGEVKPSDLFAITEGLDEFDIARRYGVTIEKIDRENRLVTASDGTCTGYETLVIATGSRPRWPTIKGIFRDGVYTFRDMADAEKLAARKVRSRHTVVIGGGLLGLETARALSCFNTQVTVLEHSSRVMFNQLDPASAECLAREITAQGIEIRTSVTVKEVRGDYSVRSLELGGGEILPCDTLVVAAGISPNIELAKGAGLSVGHGIRVDESLKTSDPNIFAVGECAEYEGIVYGLVAPGLEQARVAASIIVGESARYRGSISATQLKVSSIPVFSAGAVSNPPPLTRTISYAPARNSHRALKVYRGRLLGTAGVGEWRDVPRLQDMVAKQARVWPWQLWRFRRAGSLWPESANDSVANWPASSTICNCMNVSRGTISTAIDRGCKTPCELANATGASTVCGSCAPLLGDLLGGSAKPTPIPAFRSFATLSLLCALAALLAVFAPGLPFFLSVQAEYNWNSLWTDSFNKQVSGFTLLGLGLIATLLSMRKRLPDVQWLKYTAWRYAHVVLGAVLLIVLLVHTGFRLGDNLNLILMSCFLIVAFSGALGGLVIANEHDMRPKNAKALRSASQWLHLIALWPLPILLGFHVLKTYYF